jgi:hypothetical protein
MKGLLSQPSVIESVVHSLALLLILMPSIDISNRLSCLYFALQVAYGGRYQPVALTASIDVTIHDYQAV